MKIRSIFLSLILILVTGLTKAQEELADTTAVNGTGGGNPFKTPTKDFGMFYWGVGIGLLLLLVALIYRWRTRGEQ